MSVQYYEGIGRRKESTAACAFDERLWRVYRQRQTG